MRYLITTVLLALAIQSFGQFAKGDKALGGTFFLSTRNGSNDETNRALEITPNFGVFLRSCLEVGGQLSLSKSDRYYTYAPASYIGENSQSHLLIGFYTQKYFTLADRFMFTLLGSISVGTKTDWSKTTSGTQIDEEENKNNNAELAIAPRFIFLPSTHWALQLGLGNISYEYTWNKDGGKQNDFNINYGQVDLGVVYYFRSSE